MTELLIYALRQPPSQYLICDIIAEFKTSLCFFEVCAFNLNLKDNDDRALSYFYPSLALDLKVVLLSLDHKLTLTSEIF